MATMASNMISNIMFATIGEFSLKYDVITDIVEIVYNGKVYTVDINENKEEIRFLKGNAVTIEGKKYYVVAMPFMLLTITDDSFFEEKGGKGWLVAETVEINGKTFKYVLMSPQCATNYYDENIPNPELDQVFDDYEIDELEKVVEQNIKRYSKMIGKKVWNNAIIHAPPIED